MEAQKVAEAEKEAARAAEAARGHSPKEKQDAIKSVIKNNDHYQTVARAVTITSLAFKFASDRLKIHSAIIKLKKETEEKERKLLGWPG